MASRMRLEREEDELEPQRALEVEDDSDDDWEEEQEGTAAATAQEYLRRVRREAKRMGDIITRPRMQEQGKEQDTHYAQGAVEVTAQDDFASCREELIPSVRWERVYLRYFTRLHEIVDGKREERRGTAGWKPMPPLVTAEEGWAAKCHEEEGEEPSLKQMLFLDARSLLRMLWAFSSFLEGVEEEEARRRLLRGRGGAWLFAMLVFVEKPCDADTLAALRSIVKTLCRVRRGMRGEEEEVSAVNVLVTIIGTFYGQLPVRPEVYEEEEWEEEEWEEEEEGERENTGKEEETK
ncbi:hypothetical protein GUITHDRAFT_122321 [Guillardia theta CCMP2712]|uniref:Gem-associated protein 2 n=1 Tax=Guillardia theta (strain CCMP2712) TaxID=905079 RepID=L1I5G8_GUITC|nr:hypothetical protein GUITHDRAFT_122321 [Guillardia theta CCMP2712]EKX31486.1 hypothetical protein GUITHDRAFT_122321 [Guillardia theta CCMP2712]|eukprot:XP_005818466.1 hypothetical protein GUITHDRAFT_122321 [Guillardia theta CCMP2712]